MNFSCIKPSYILIGLLCATTAFGQLRLYPLPQAGVEPVKKTNANTRSMDHELQLPFWDDFSSYTGSPDTSLWEAGSGVYVNRTRGINPPTLGVATFDGATANGGIYSTDVDAIGLTDTLVSNPIQLGTISSAEINNVYLSFFWEFEGNQEMPDKEDSLRLLFRNQNNEWVPIDVFTLSDVTSDSTFQQVIYQVKPEFLHNNFQFKFEDYGRLSGPYDAWHIDYVYLNKGRQVNDKVFFDRAISFPPTSLLKGYWAVPFKQFFAKPEEYLSKSSVSIYNLDKIFQPIAYTAIVTNALNPSEVYDTLNFNTPLNPILQGNERRTLNSSPLTLNALDKNLDSIFLNLKFYISSGDSILPNGINYRLNDTASATMAISNYYAYDDGTAEFGLGLDQNSGEIAYMFVLNKPDILNRIDISFINIGSDESNAPFNLYIWKRLTGKPADLLYKRESQSIQPIRELNQFQTIKLEETEVVDTFYVGLEQLTSNYFVVGYDKNDDNGSRIFYNVDGAWQQNKALKGSLMIRPYFSTSDIPLALDKPEQPPEIKIFPNPASGILNIEGPVSELELFTISGMKAGHWKMQPGDRRNRVDISMYPPGIYILHYNTNTSGGSSKLIISH